jgi:hypothetical protein
MALMTASPNQLNANERRRSQRLPLRVPILVEGKTVDGKTFQDKTHTLEINRYGARIVLQSNPQPGGRVAITNLQTKSKCPFQVISRPGKPLDKEKGTEHGVECLDPGTNIWGVSFPESEGTAPDPGEVDVLLECPKCRSRELARVTQSQYQTFVTQSSARRSCLKCEAITEWRVVYLDGDAQGETPRPQPGLPEAQPPMPTEQRRERRLAMRLPVRIRLEEIGETEDLSPSGLCFTTELTLKCGDRVWLTVGYAPGGNEKEVAARVMWRKEIPGGNRALYGVQLEHDE